MSAPKCGFTGGAHIFEHCTCELITCRRWVCVGCDYWVDRAKEASA